MPSRNTQQDTGRKGPGHAKPCQSEFLSCLFFEATTDAIIVVNENGTIVQVNVQAEKLFGYRRDELLDGKLEMLIPERLRTGHADHLRAYFRNPWPRSMDTSLTAIGLRKDGTEMPVDIALSPLPTEAGLFVASAVRDVTSRRRLETELRQHMRRLEEADRHKDQFLTMLAHELSNPLAAISYCVELLRQPEVAAGVRIEAAQRALEQVNHMQHLSKDLGELSRIRLGDVTLQCVPADLIGIAHQAADWVRPLIEESGLSLEVLVPSSPVTVVGDGSRLRQIATNLLTNATRYTPEGGAIRLSVERDNGTAILSVKDNGIGIPPNELGRVFDLFTRLEGAKRRYAGGMGVGLALVRRLAEIHGGTVQAISEGENRGSEFVVRLPLAQVTTAPNTPMVSITD